MVNGTPAGASATFASSVVRKGGLQDSLASTEIPLHAVAGSTDSIIPSTTAPESVTSAPTPIRLPASQVKPIAVPVTTQTNTFIPPTFPAAVQPAVPSPAASIMSPVIFAPFPDAERHGWSLAFVHTGPAGDGSESGLPPYEAA